tara:strand:- start:388 stop:519 length:132 start_codon:yes stop_codon:yes gene_type:complete
MPQGEDAYQPQHPFPGVKGIGYYQHYKKKYMVIGIPVQHVFQA